MSRRQPTIGHLVFGIGVLLGVFLSWYAWKPQSDDNPFVALLLLWVVAGLAHMVVPWFWSACLIAAVGSALGYVVLALLFAPDPLSNDMFGPGIIEMGLVGFVFAMLMGIPVVISRRARKAGDEADPIEGG